MTANGSEPAWMAELKETLNAWVGGGETVKYRAFFALLPHVYAAYKRGLVAGKSQSGYRLVQENERLRRELKLAHQAEGGGGICPSCLSVTDVAESCASAPEQAP